MVTIHVKTLDGSNRQFQVSDDLTVGQFKKLIAPTVNLTAVNQRLIYHGRVLQDQQILNALDLDGKTLHLVEKARNQGGPSQNTTTQPNLPNFPHRHEMPGQQILFSRVVVPPNFNFSQFSDVNTSMFTNSVGRVMNRFGDVGRRAMLNVNLTPTNNTVEMTLVLRDEPPSEVESSVSARLRGVQLLINHQSSQMNDLGGFRDEPAATEAQGSSTSNDVTPKPSASSSRTAESGNSAQSRDLDGVEAAQGQNTQNQREAAISHYIRVFEDFLRFQERLQPLIRRYLRFLRDDFNYDPNSVEGIRANLRVQDMQPLFNNFSYIYHTFGNLAVQLGQPSPRVVESSVNANPRVVFRTREGESQSSGPFNATDSASVDTRANEFESVMEHLLRSFLDSMRNNPSAPATSFTAETVTTTPTTTSQPTTTGPRFTSTPLVVSGTGGRPLFTGNSIVVGTATIGIGADGNAVLLNSTSNTPSGVQAPRFQAGVRPPMGVRSRPPISIRPQFATGSPIFLNASAPRPVLPSWSQFLANANASASATPPTTAAPRQNEMPPGQQSRDSSAAASLTGARNDQTLTPRQPVENEPTNVPSASTTPKNDQAEDNWKENVPREWVPIIEEDMEKQASTEIQQPFSDAYLSGMPLKRRKVICDSKPNLNTESESLIRQMIQTSVQEGGARSSNTSQSAEEAVTSLRLRPELVQSFEASVREKIRSRTEFDPDFDEKRFENVKKMFDSSK